MHKIRFLLRDLASSWLLVAFVACTMDATDESSSGFQGDEAPKAELRPGATGQEVAELQELLSNRGFLPNAELAQAFVAWQPVIDTSPAKGTYDSATADAVRMYQQSRGLPQSGVADARTREQLSQLHCGVPDNLETHGAGDKFARQTGLSRTDIRWTVVGELPGANGSPAISNARLQQVASWAFSRWDRYAPPSKLKFVYTPSGTTDIKIQVGSLPSTTAARWHYDNRTLTLNPNARFSDGTPPPADMIDLHRVIVHEIGHALGLAHCSDVGAVMYPDGRLGLLNREPSHDDRAGLATKRDTFDPTQIGIARDIGVGHNGHVWAITNMPYGDGYRIVMRVGNTWQETAPAGGAVRVAVASNGGAWVVTSTGAIFWHSPDLNDPAGWELFPGCARDIGVGADGFPWIISCTERTPGDTTGGWIVMKLTWNWAFGWIPDPDESGTRIAVDAQNLPWVVRTNGTVSRRNSPDINVRFWTYLGGSAWDIAVAPDQTLDPNGTGARASRAWIVSQVSKAGGYQVHVRNEQPALAIGNPAIPRQNEWVPVLGPGALNIGAGPNGVWITDLSFRMFKQW